MEKILEVHFNAICGAYWCIFIGCTQMYALLTGVWPEWKLSQFSTISRNSTLENGHFTKFNMRKDSLQNSVSEKQTLHKIQCQKNGLFTSDRLNIQFRRVLAKNKDFGKISVSAKKWPNFRPKSKQPVFLKSNLAIKHFRSFNLYYRR